MRRRTLRLGPALLVLAAVMVAAAGCAAAPGAIPASGSPFDTAAGASQIEVMAALDAEANRIADLQTGRGFVVAVIVILLAVAFGGAPPTGN